MRIAMRISIRMMSIVTPIGILQYRYWVIYCGTILAAAIPIPILLARCLHMAVSLIENGSQLHIVGIRLACAVYALYTFGQTCV